MKLEANCYQPEAAFLMQEQQQVGRARIIGYAIGIVVFLAMGAWKYFVR